MYSETIRRLEDLTDDKAFERLACDLLSRLGYPGIEPLGDPGEPDARLRSAKMIAQASLEKNWASKMKKDAEKVFGKYGLTPKAFVFVTNRKATKAKRDAAIGDLEAKYPGVAFELFDQERLRVELDANSQDLREEYLGIPPSPQPSRWNVPIPKNPNFVGREDDMKRLRDAIEGKREKGEVVNVVGATGIAGIGKSQLAAEYAHKHRNDLRGGVYWVDAGSEDLTSEFYSLAPFMGVDLPDQPTTEAIQAVVIKVMNHLGGSEPSLLILDNVTEPKILQCWTLPGPGWLPPGGECRVLATSRRTDLPNTTNLDIEKLEPEPAFNLLTSKRNPEGREEKEAAERICRQVDYLPLALEIAGAYLGQYESVSFDGFSERIEADGALDPLDDAAKGKITHSHGEVGVRAVLKEMTSQIKGDALKLLLAVGCCPPASMNPSMLAAVAQLEMEGKRGRPAPLERAANALAASSLLKRDPETGRFVSHALVHEFARNGLGTDDERASAASCFFALLGSVFDAQEDQRPPLRQALLSEVPHCIAAYGLAVSAQHWPWACHVANGLGSFHLETARHDSAHSWFDKALRAAKRIGDRPDLEATIRSNIGGVLHCEGDYGGALAAFKSALVVEERLVGSDHPKVATRVNNIGSVLHDQGDYDGALEAFRRALEIDEKAFGPDHPDVAICVNNIGSLLVRMGKPDEAMPYFCRAYRICKTKLGPHHPNAKTTADWLRSIGVDPEKECQEQT
jgi:tetratricopeptide (TPR) repeat protein